MKGEKAAIQSLGVWGSILSILPIIADQVSQAAGAGQFGPHGLLVAAAVGGLVSLVGRLRAEKLITRIF